MNGKTIFDGNTPKTQSVEAVCALLLWKARPHDPLPLFVEIGNGEDHVVLVLSNKRDCFYVVTPRACSCPSATYHPGQSCKHQRKYFPEQQTATRPKPTPASIRPDMRGFKPISPLPSEEKAKASPSLIDRMLIDCHDTTEKEAAYWSIKEDKILWPAEA